MDRYSLEDPAFKLYSIKNMRTRKQHQKEKFTERQLLDGHCFQV